jgi:hypothetical protein
MSVKSEYNLRFNYNKIYNKSILPLIKSKRNDFYLNKVNNVLKKKRKTVLKSNNYSFSEKPIHCVQRVIREKNTYYFCELKSNQSLTFVWLKKSEFTLKQISLFNNPKNYLINLSRFRSDFKRKLIYCLTKSQSNNICFKISLNEEIYRKVIKEVKLTINSNNRNLLEIDKKNFLKLFGFDLNEILLKDIKKQFIKPKYPVFLCKPRFIIRSNSYYKIDYKSEPEDIYTLTEFLKFKVDFNCGNLI